MRTWFILLLILAFLLAGCVGNTRGATATQEPPRSARVATRPPASLQAPTATAAPTQTSTPRPTLVPSPAATRTDIPAPTDVPATQRPRLATAVATQAPPTRAAPTKAPRTPTATPTVVRKAAGPASWLKNTTILAEYGRAFNVAPVLGRVGLFGNMDDFAQDVAVWEAKIRPHNGGKKIRPAIHLIYAMATPCGGDCLSYLDDDAGVDIVREYIEPARKRGWLVVLDTQLGSSDPVAQVRRMMAKGYLRYDNVQVALDPEFRAAPGQATPGIPIGSVAAHEVNAAANLLGEYTRSHKLAHKKILLVHSFNFAMIREGAEVRGHPDVDLVLDADGFGSPSLKVATYNALTKRDSFPHIRHRGIKLFPEGPSAPPGHSDTPLLTFRQVFGLEPVEGGERILLRPDVIIIT